MATMPRKPSAERPQINFKQAVEMLSREEAFMGTVAAMNALLIQKGVYTAEEFDTLFCSWALAQQEKKASASSN